jgi:hypothetical protein
MFSTSFTRVRSNLNRGYPLQACSAGMVSVYLSVCGTDIILNYLHVMPRCLCFQECRSTADFMFSSEHDEIPREDSRRRDLWQSRRFRMFVLKGSGKRTRRPPQKKENTASLSRLGETGWKRSQGNSTTTGRFLFDNS